MGILKRLDGQISSVPTLFVVDTHVNRSQRRAKERAKTTPATYGHGLENVLAFLDPVTRSWKMYEDTYRLADLPSLEKLPNSGIARNGVLYQRPPWEPLTGAIGLSSWPTPTARDWKGPSGRSIKGLERDLPAAVGNGGRLNPAWIEWLMGFPAGWTDLNVSETP